MDEIAVIAPSASEVELAKQAWGCIRGKKLGGLSTVPLRIGSGDETINVEIPASVLRLMLSALSALSRGCSIALIPTNARLTSQQAADLLDMSRESFEKLLDEGRMPFQSLARFRTVRFDDLMAFRRNEPSEPSGG
jgi:excisionase family DNA binding protein